MFYLIRRVIVKLPVSRITKRTEQVLIVHKQVTGLSNPKLLEIAVLQMQIIPKKGDHR